MPSAWRTVISATPYSLASAAEEGSCCPAAYAPVAGTVIEVDTPGLTAVNPHRFDYRHIRRPLYPLDH